MISDEVKAAASQTSSAMMDATSNRRTDFFIADVWPPDSLAWRTPIVKVDV